MKLIKSSLETLDQEPGLQGIYKQIELAGRTCYKSLDKSTEDSAEGFVDRMIASQHYAMLEHGTVYLIYPSYVMKEDIHYYNNPYSVVNEVIFTNSDNNHWRKQCFVTTNYRVLVENGWLDDLRYLCEPTEFHEKRITVRFTTDRGVSHEFVRHKLLCVA